MALTRWSQPWRDRPSEQAALFNPAFCGELISRTVAAYDVGRGGPLPFALAFLVLPLALHPGARAALPVRSDTTFATWAAEHGAMLAELPDRVMALRPITREALLFLTQHSALTVTGRGVGLGSRALKLTPKPAITTDDAQAARRTAGFIGRWLANQASTAFVLQTLGVRP
ncbi:MAG: hypothetical protein E5Y34_12605 [Mesorhizobium sp.]|uniref:three component ABC system middle component n=1 Tax=Mesorhizobium sp. TaxID=1871066 RepID=UPI00121ADCB7|nr:three component ABC system middle component [Mesorhizobium sp.]TIN00362.1 MAG: hypothetical protein E5Y34_12605 [Mesorhizobium sp.]